MRQTGVFDGKEIALAWGLKIDPETGQAPNAANAFNPWAVKLRQMLDRYPTKVYQLLGELAAEIERDRER